MSECCHDHDHGHAYPPPSADPVEELARRDELQERLRWLIKLRWIALLGVGAAVGVAAWLGLISSPWPLLGVALAMGLLNLYLMGLHFHGGERSLRALTMEALLQSGVDVLGLGMLLFFSGGLANPFIFFFVFHVAITAALLDRRKAYGVAGFTALIVGLLFVAERYGLTWELRGPLESSGHPLVADLGLAFVIGTTLFITAFFVSEIMERLGLRSRDVRRLNADLAEQVARLAAAERRLKAEHQRAQAILECMDEGVVVVDLSGEKLLSNGAAKASALSALEDTLTRAGVRIANPAPRPVPAVLPPSGGACPAALDICVSISDDGKLPPELLAMISNSAPAPKPVLRVRPPAEPVLVQLELNGRRFENTVSGVRTADGEALGVVVVSRDVTERHSLERQVVHAEKLHAIGNLAAGVSHELNTPLGTILGYAQMLLEDPRCQAMARDLGSIEEQARRCRRIVQSMLDFARKSGGGRERLGAGEIVAKAAELTRHPLEMRGIELRVDALPGGDAAVLANAHELQQVLVNLITNAADALDEVPPEKRAQNGGKIFVRHGRDAASGETLIAVEDNGPGVSEIARAEIFEPFFTTKAAGKGTGLGLPIARRIVEDHGGALTLAASKPGSGACFEVRFPYAGVPQPIAATSNAAK